MKFNELEEYKAYVIREKNPHECPYCCCSRCYNEFLFIEKPAGEYLKDLLNDYFYLKNEADMVRFRCPSCIYRRVQND